MRKIVLIAITIYSLGLGGCSTLEIDPSSHARLPSGKYVHIPLVSFDEEKLLREATERALVLHSQLRAFDIANKAVERRIARLRNETLLSSKGNRRGSLKALKDPELGNINKFDVRFAKGSVAIDEKIATDLSRALANGKFSQGVQPSELKQFVVLQVATHKKEGIDSYNARRLGAIHELFKKHNIPADAIKLKIVRIPSTIHEYELKADGNASRTIQLSSVRLAKLEL